MGTAAQGLCCTTVSCVSRGHSPAEPPLSASRSSPPGPEAADRGHSGQIAFGRRSAAAGSGRRAGGVSSFEPREPQARPRSAARRAPGPSRGLSQAAGRVCGVPQPAPGRVRLRAAAPRSSHHPAAFRASVAFSLPNRSEGAAEVPSLRTLPEESQARPGDQVAPRLRPQARGAARLPRGLQGPSPPEAPALEVR